MGKHDDTNEVPEKSKLRKIKKAAVALTAATAIFGVTFVLGRTVRGRVTTQ